MESFQDNLTINEQKNEEIKLQGKILLLRLYGKKGSLDFYKQKYTEFLSIFFSNEIITTLCNDITIENFWDFCPIIDEYPTNDIDAWNKLHNYLPTDESWTQELNVLRILMQISQLDIRIAMVLFFSLGLMPGKLTLRDFSDSYSINYGIVQSLATKGIGILINDIVDDNMPMISKDNIKELFSFMSSLESFNTMSLIRFTNGELVIYESSTYQLALHLYSYRHINMSLLTKLQKKIVKIFTRHLNSTETFTLPIDIAEELEMHQSSIVKHFSRIKNKLTENKFYIKNREGRITPIPEDSNLAKLIELYKKDPNIINHPNLITVMPLMEFLIDLMTPDKQRKNVFPSLYETAAKHKGISPAHVIEDILNRINNLDSNKITYFDENGRRLGPNTLRMQLLNIYQNHEIRSKFKIKHQMIIDLLMVREGNKFIYTPEEIEFKLKEMQSDLRLTTKDVEKSIQQHLFNIWRIIRKISREQ